jgi:hypothetical protein
MNGVNYDTQVHVIKERDLVVCEKQPTLFIARNNQTWVTRVIAAYSEEARKAQCWNIVRAGDAVRIPLFGYELPADKTTVNLFELALCLASELMPKHAIIKVANFYVAEQLVKVNDRQVVLVGAAFVVSS